jgi:CheY-like chemotaxis protein
MSSSPRIRPESSEPGFGIGARGHVLVIDDDPAAAEFFRHALAVRGRFQVAHTPDPATALALVAVGRWDLMITDLNLPGMSGADLLAELRRIAPQLPAILVTAHPEGVRCPVEANAVLAKPVPVDTLLATAIDLVNRGRRAASAR